jgi:hypothetical protein
MARTLKDDLLPMVDRLREIPGMLGLRVLTAFVRVVTWSGTRVGEGTRAVADTQLVVGPGRQPVKVESVSAEDVAASGGLYQAQDLRIGPLTPDYADLLLVGGYKKSDIDPAVGTLPTEIFVVIKGASKSPTGDLYKRVGLGDEEASALHRIFVVRSLGIPA